MKAHSKASKTVSAGDTLKTEHVTWRARKLKLSFSIMKLSSALQLVTPQQEAAALVEGASEGMWLDMWILPNYIEAERAGCLQAWLQEVAPQGSMNLDYQMIASIQPASQDLKLCSSPVNGNTCFGKTCYACKSQSFKSARVVVVKTGY